MRYECADTTGKNILSDAETETKPICTLIAASTLALCMFTPRMLVTLPIMVTLGLSIAAGFRKEWPKFAPYVIGALAVGLVVIGNASLPSFPTAPPPTVSNADLYGDAKWDYESDKDEMRGTVSKWATLDSATELNLNSPYEGQNHARIQIDHGDIILTVDKGQIMCRKELGIPVKFDNDSVVNFACDTPDNGDSKTIYINNRIKNQNGDEFKNNYLDDKISKSKTMTIEVEFYDSGTRQIIFKVTGLDQSKY